LSASLIANGVLYEAAY